MVFHIHQSIQTFLLSHHHSVLFSLSILIYSLLKVGCSLNYITKISSRLFLCSSERLTHFYIQNKDVWYLLVSWCENTNYFLWNFTSSCLPKLYKNLLAPTRTGVTRKQTNFLNFNDQHFLALKKVEMDLLWMINSQLLSDRRFWTQILFLQ